MGVASIRITASTSMKLILVIIASLLLVLLPVVAEAQISSPSHHQQHTNVIACSAACSPSASKLGTEPLQQNTKLESSKIDKHTTLSRTEEADIDPPDIVEEPLYSFVLDESDNYKVIASYLL